MQDEVAINKQTTLSMSLSLSALDVDRISKSNIVVVVVVASGVRRRYRDQRICSLCVRVWCACVSVISRVGMYVLVAADRSARVHARNGGAWLSVQCACLRLSRFSS